MQMHLSVLPAEFIEYKKRMVTMLHRYIVSFIFTLTFISACSSSDPDTVGGAVSAATPEAADAGVEIMKVGGNAIDAAVAVGFVLAVTEPGMSGLGGQSQIILQAPGEDPLVLNGTSFVPEKMPSDVKRDDLTGRRLTTIPTTVRVLHYAWEQYGSGKITWKRILAPAIRYARDGYTLGPFRHRVRLRHADKLRQNTAASELFLNPDGSVPAEGSRIRQARLARTLQDLAVYGAMAFYTGDIAREIVADIQNNSGWITMEDLQQLPEPSELSPLKGAYRDWDVYSLPPPGGGWVVLQMLNILEQTPTESLISNPVTRIPTLADALHIGHLDRQLNPVRNLLEYEAEVSEKTGKDTADRLRKERDTSGETTHYSVVDGDGMVVGVTASVNAYFGAKVANPTLGFLYNSYMTEFELGDPEHPFALRPGAMPYSSMSPTILAKGNIPHMVLGSPGSARIISAITQVVHQWTDGGMSITEAVAAPRIHATPGRKLYIESPDISDDMRQAVIDKGYSLTSPRTDLANDSGNPYYGGVHAVAREEGVWIGAADPRRDGAVRYVDAQN